MHESMLANVETITMKTLHMVTGLKHDRNCDFVCDLPRFLTEGIHPGCRQRPSTHPLKYRERDERTTVVPPLDDISPPLLEESH